MLWNNPVEPKSSRRPVLHRLLKDQRGVAAMFFALSVPVILGAVAYAVDFTNYRVTHNRLQTAADAAAIAGVKSLDAPNMTVAQAIQFARLNVPASYGDITRQSDVIIGVFDPATGFSPSSDAREINAVRVRAVRNSTRGNPVRAVLASLWNTADVSLSAEATAARQLNVQYEPAERFMLEPEAWDYNEIWAYCYDRNATGPVANRRSQMTLLGNNLPEGTNATRYSNGYITEVPANPPTWPDCSEQGQALSFRLRNIREAKQYPENFRNGRRQEYNYYTDTIISGGVEHFNLSEPILETVLCDTEALCDPSKRNSQVPKGKNRTPKVETRPCAPGKYMYFGWEDRPPSGGSDRDYDDITMLMKCPSVGTLGDGITRLVG